MHLVAAVVVLGLLGGAVCCVRSRPSSSSATASYSDCVKQGGHTASYVGAIQVDACLGDNDRLLLQYSAQNMPRISEYKLATATNNVVYTASDPVDLVTFLMHDETGCGSAGTVGYYKITKVVPNRFAEMDYGCDTNTAKQKASAHVIAMKLGYTWALLSPTNNMDDNGVPSCLLVDMFRISKRLSDQCYQNTGHNDGSLRPVTYE